MKVLVVDDNADARVLQKTVLEARGHSVETAVNGVEALEAARRFVPDMLVSDILMPEMDGYGLCQAIRGDERLKDIPVLLVTSTYTEPIDEKLALDFGASRCIVRPVDPEELVRVVEEVFEEHGKKGAPAPKGPAAAEEELEERHERVVARKLDKKVRELEAEREALRASEAKFRALVESAPTVVIALSMDCRILEFNSEAGRFYGVGRDEALGQDYIERFLPEEAREEVRKDIASVLSGRPTIGYENPVLAADGRERILSWYVSSFPEAGEPIGVICLGYDVTERRAAEEALRESEARFKALVSNIPGATYRCAMDQYWTMEYISEGITAVSGYPADDFLGNRMRTYASIIHPDDVRLVEDAVARAVRIAEPYTIEYRISHADGGVRWVYERGQGVLDSDGKVLWLDGAIFDITDRKIAEVEIRREVDMNRNLLKLSAATAQTTDVARLMGEVVECVREVLGTDLCLSYLSEKEDGGFKAGASAGLHHELVPPFMTMAVSDEAPLIKKALGTRLPALASFSSEAGRAEIEGLGLEVWLKDIGAIVIIPLVGRSATLGLLVCVYGQQNSRAAGGLSDREKMLMMGITNQVSTALEEANLYEESFKKTVSLTHMIEVVRTMHEIDRSILSTLEPREILDTAVNMISRVLACDCASVLLRDPEKEALVYASGFSISSEHKLDQLVEDPLAERVIHTLMPEYLSSDAGLEAKKGFVCKGCKSRLVVPLVIKGRGVGVLSVGSRLPAAFTAENISTLDKITAQIGIALENARLVEDLEELFLGTVRTLSEAIDAKSPWTRGHSDRVTEYALKIAGELGLDDKDLKDLELAGLLHDIGKLGTYEYILDKPGKLTEEETEVMQQHPGKGADILAPIKQLKGILPVIRSHHEFYDGSGYPGGLRGDAIPFMSRILTVADTADAMGADRPYRSGMEMDEIVKELKRCSGTQFDPRVVEAFLKTIGTDERRSALVEVEND